MNPGEWVRTRVASFYARVVALICARPGRAALVLGLACVPAVILTVQFFMDIRPDLKELLPKTSPSVVAIDHLQARLGGKFVFKVIVQSDDVAANHRFADLLAERLRARHLPETRIIESRIDEERDWLKAHALLLAPKKTFDTLMDEAEGAIKQAKLKANPLYIDLDDDGPKVDPWKKVDELVRKEAAANDRFPNGYLETQDGKTVIVLVWLEGSAVEFEPSARLLASTQADVAALRPQFSPKMVVAYNGDVADMVEEHEAILADLSISSLMVFVLVAALIAFYFRSLRAVVAVLWALGPGLLFTFAIGRLTVGSLNSNTAFLGSIIAGNGINYPLLLLAYYRRRPADEPNPVAIPRAAAAALKGTLGAAATASAAYAGLAASSFKGFSQFGWLGGMGMLTTWLFAFITMPIAIALLKPPRQGSQATTAQAALMRFFDNRRLSAAVAALFVGVMAVALAFGAREAKRSGLYEQNLLALRNRDSLAHGSASWDAKTNEIFGAWLTPVAALVDRPKDRETVVRALSDKLLTGPHPPAERVESIDTVVPDPALQEARLVRLRKLAADVAKVPREQIPEKAREMVDLWLKPERLVAIRVKDVPFSLRHAYAEKDGSTDKVVLVYPSLQVNYNDARNIVHFATLLKQVDLPAGTVVGGAFLFMAEIVRLVSEEVPGVVGIVCLLVALVLVPFFFRRPARILIIVASVTAVALTAQAAMLALGVKVNILNFAAVPITIGVGADYVVNLFGGMDALDASPRQACAQMGGAILLCSLTTVVGYVSLLIAQSGALRTFGWAAVLGEASACTMVLLVLPVLLPSKRGEAAAPRS